MLVSFLKRCTMKSSTKLVRRNSCWLVLMRSSVPEWTNQIVLLYFTIFSIIKILGRPFCLTNISAWKDDNTLIFFSKDAPSKALLQLYDKNYYCKVKNFFPKQKFLFNIFMTLSKVRQNTFVWLLHFRYRRHHQNNSIGISSYNLCRAFHGASFEKKLKVLTFVCGEIFSNY